MKDAAFSDGIFSNIVVLRNQAPHSDRQNTDLLLHYLLSYLQRYRQSRFQLFARYLHGRRVRPADLTNLYYPSQRR